ncbi:MAG: indole-3-glycerol phosphate synthase TrpC [Immundisolibacter sp.]
MNTPDILKKILAAKADELAAAQRVRSLHELRREAEAMPATRGFAAALTARVTRRQAAVIAEIKQASPSKGLLRVDFDPPAIARSYRAGGAACVSVLTDGPFFGGSLDHLRAVRAAVELPLLRKDFLLDPYQVYEARAAGADCILLIVAALDDARLADLYAVAAELGLDALIEVHDEYELDRALALSPRLLGVNNRNLHTFETRLDTTLRLAGRVPRDSVLVAESGVHTAADVARIRAAGVHAFLIGEAFMRAADPGAGLAELFPTEA